MDHAGDATAASIAIVAIMIYGVFIIALLIFGIWLQWRILEKAGYSGWLSLLLLTGIGGLIIQLILAFGEWPVHRDLAMARSYGGNPYGSTASAVPTPPIGGPPMPT